jgi:Cdc6-like AAA superfamily ATPase
MSEPSKPRNPFLPGQPATVDLFVGREEQIARLLQRGVRQTALGKPTAFFIEGEYGIGKSSLANYCLQWAEQEYGMLGISAFMAGHRTLQGAAESILKAVVVAAHRNRTLWGRVKDGLGRFVDSAELFGVSLRLPTIGQEGARLADVGGFLQFLSGVVSNLPGKEGYRPSVFLVLDEINGIATEPDFGHFLKGVVDRNALAAPQLPLCLVLCGTPARRQESPATSRWVASLTSSRCPR